MSDQPYHPQQPHRGTPSDPYGAAEPGVPPPAAGTPHLPPQRPNPGPMPPEQDGRPSAGGRRRTGGTAGPARGPAAASRPSGDPVVPPGAEAATLTAALAALLAVGALLGRPVLAAAVAVLQAVTAAGWFRLNGMWPARQGIALAFLAGLTADAALLATGGEHASTAVVGTLGVWCVLALVLQLRHRGSADERLYALAAAVAATALTVVAAGHLAADPEAVAAGAAGAAAAALARVPPLPPVISPAVALLAAAGAGVAVGGPTSLGAPGALLGLAAGACALVGLRVASYDFPSRFVHLTAGVALPLTAAAPAVYLLGRALG